MMLQAVRVLADLPPNPGPSSAGLPGIPALPTIFGWLVFGSIAVCAACAIMSGARLAYGNHSGRPDMAMQGKSGLLWSIGGAFLIAIAAPLVYSVYGLAGH